MRSLWVVGLPAPVAAECLMLISCQDQRGKYCIFKIKTPKVIGVVNSLKGQRKVSAPPPGQSVQSLLLLVLSRMQKCQLSLLCSVLAGEESAEGGWARLTHLR